MNFSPISFISVQDTGSFPPSGSYQAEYLIVGGGGASSTNGAGGGGAGGFRNGQTNIISGSLYTVTIGAGGTCPNTLSPGGNGNNSSFGQIVAAGGGGAGGGLAGNGVFGLNGASGGGNDNV
jgi:hypothetical protein